MRHDEDEEQPEPGICCSLGGGHQVDDQETEAVEDYGVQPADFTDNKVLEPGNSVKHFKDHVPLLQGAELELLHHLLDTAQIDPSNVEIHPLKPKLLRNLCVCQLFCTVYS